VKSLPLWAYTGAAIIDDEFCVPALRIDTDVRSDPALHENHDELDRAIKHILKLYPKNRLIKQLAICSTQYGCLCARNFFLSRYEAPVPVSMQCNAFCLGCLSHQNKESDFTHSQPRLNFHPSPEEIAELILHHFNNAYNPIASFGQGCEGEPLLRGDDLVRAVSLVRQKTFLGTLNINTNASKPEVIKNMIKEGLNSIRVSINSPTPEYYNKYYTPCNYKLEDVYASLDAALSAGIFVSLNLFFMPGFTDSIKESEALFKFLDKFPVDMIQTRNLNIDPDYYFDKIEFNDDNVLGVRNLINALKERYPQIKLGYYNPAIKIDKTKL
jgi:MoaA/NifB/PqqE/SkfB family radical SAM enzyme